MVTVETLTEIVILHYNPTDRKSRLAKNLIIGNWRFNNSYELLLNENSYLEQLPALQYGDKIIFGLANIQKLLAKVVQGKTVEQIFNRSEEIFSKKEEETTRNKTTTRLTKNQIIFFGGYIIGGIFAVALAYLEKVGIIFNLVTLITPITIVIFFPEIKQAIKKIRVKKRV